MDRLQNIETFVRVAEAQSFAEAARQLRVARSVVTTRIKQLEDDIGAALFYRSTRVVRLTEVGLSYLKECSELVARANDLVDHMRDERDSLHGTLRIHAAIGLVLNHFAPVLHRFHEAYPDIQVQVSVSDDKVDPVKLGVDCAFQVFRTDATGWISKPLFRVHRIFCATPAYLQAHGTPTHPDELQQHRVSFYSRYPTRNRWIFRRGTQEITVGLAPVLLSNSVHLLHEYTLQGGSIASLPTWAAADSLLSGKLRPVLSDYLLRPLWLHAVFSPESRNARKLRLFLDHVTSHFAGVAPWEDALAERGLIPRDAADIVWPETS